MTRRRLVLLLLTASALTAWSLTQFFGQLGWNEGE